MMVVVNKMVVDGGSNNINAAIVATFEMIWMIYFISPRLPPNVTNQSVLFCQFSVL